VYLQQFRQELLCAAAERRSRFLAAARA